ncbi:hypothetical protein [Xylella fastidiosa]|nr:hypothetical protein [Xylella fastidiosa]WNY18548.1 hypothetical protein RO839_08670 [Xylella fastidiosa]WNY20835.1 hypothetical protein RO838_08685 [Xylella fastidiosa]
MLITGALSRSNHPEGGVSENGWPKYVQRAQRFSVGMDTVMFLSGSAAL